MQAHVVEATQLLAVAQDHDGLVPDACRDELAVLPKLLHPANQLPRVREHTLAFQLEVDGIVVEARRDGGGTLDVRVEREDERHGSAGSGPSDKLARVRVGG